MTASGSRGGLSGLVSGSLYESGGSPACTIQSIPESNGGFADNVDGDRYAHLFSELRHGKLRLQGLYGSRRKIIPTADYDTNFGDPGTRVTDTIAEFDADYTRSLTPTTVLELRPFYQHYAYEGTYAYGGTNSPERYLNYDSSVADWSGLEATLDRSFGPHHLIVGGNYEYSFRVNQQSYDPGHPLFLDDHRTPWLAAGYGEVAIDLGHSLMLHAGGRLDYLDAYGAAFSPRTALVYTPGTKTSVKYIFGRAFRAPNAYENYYADGVSTERPPQPLRKEDIQSHELVVERQLVSWLSATFDGYYETLDHLIDWVPDPANGMNHAINAGEAEGRGVEFELNGRSTSGWQARASYTLADTHDRISRQPLDNSPRHQIKVNGTIPATRHAFVGVELLYASSQQTYKETRISSSFLTNLTLSTKPFWGGWEFSASCYNAADRRWFSPAAPTTAQTSIFQDGRSFGLRLSYRFGKEGNRASNEPNSALCTVAGFAFMRGGASGSFASSTGSTRDPSSLLIQPDKVHRVARRQK